MAIPQPTFVTEYSVTTPASGVGLAVGVEVGDALELAVIRGDGVGLGDNDGVEEGSPVGEAVGCAGACGLELPEQPSAPALNAAKTATS